ncbi:S-adenosyl-L-methionine dependent methyltransferase [Gigaspora margarita]|uniref:U6 small nuclear RNA (adenine-(43)-N(6))-methyltransferase n=1 Tax=Gigaspora margarita TaxID=4874 RepID=A0A8H3X067_GIGMA|nr:S-adenosyl-L-methionine dependent methyltransferase [Gigaspora margarita]
MSTSSTKGVLGKRSYSENVTNGDNAPGQMHPRNRYRNSPPDFAVLAFKYSSFYPFVHYTKEGKPYIDFKNPEAVRELTYCLLRNDFNLTLNIPLDTLCPPIPNRLNYIHWIEDLISAETRQDRSVYAIDIGTGASCIYPLLGCTLNKNWMFLATDIDERSIEYAETNVLRNNLDHRITVIHNKTDKKIMLSDEVLSNNSIKFAFCMCNPPFYESQEQYEKGVEMKHSPSLSVCTGASHEKITVGGEFQFIKDILEESLILRNKIRWYTSKIGRLETVNRIVRELKKNGIDNYVVTEFCQGQTRRWGVGWSFGTQRPSMNISQPSSKKLRKTAPPKTEFCVILSTSSDNIKKFLKQLFEQLEIVGQWNEDSYTFSGSANINTWSRAARRQRLMKADCQTESPTNVATSTDEPLFEFTCNFEPWNTSVNTTKVTVSWTNGKDRSIFESFYVHVKKKLEQEFSNDE